MLPVLTIPTVETVVSENTGKWKVWWVEGDDSEPIHIMPVVDLREHVFEADCWCSPRVEEDEEDTRLVITHHTVLRMEQWYEQYN